jgi:hypothetical protein
MNATRLYSEIGKLLYAIASADGTISASEKLKLNELMQKSLLRVKKKDQFGTPIGYYTEIEFEFLEEELIDPELAISSFLDYIEEHYSALGLHEIQLIRELAWETAESFRHINQKENKMLIRMENTFLQIKNKQLKQLKNYEND